MQTKTDNELVIGYAEGGHEAAFAELIARYQAMIFRTCFRMLGNVHDAEDARQAVFIVLARKAGSLRREGDLGGWLHRVARNVALQALDRRETQRKRQEELAMTQETVVEADQAPDTAAVLRQVDAALDGLSAILRQAVILRYLRGFSEQEAAAQAGCPVGTMKWRASEALAKLRQRLAKRGVALSGVALAGLLTSEASAAVPETLLPSILATVKTAVATTAAGTAATTTAGMLAKGAMKAMFIAKVKMVAAVVAAVVVTGTAVPVGIVVAQAVGKEGKEGTATAAVQTVDASGKATMAKESEADLDVLRKRITDNPGTLTALQCEIFLIDRKMEVKKMEVKKMAVKKSTGNTKTPWSLMEPIVAEYAVLLTKYPADVLKQQDMSGSIRLRQATCYWQADDWAMCQTVLTPFQNDAELRQNAFRAEALFMLARSYSRQNLFPKALNVLQTIIKDHADFKAIEEVYTEHARLAIEVSEWAVAAETCKRFAAKFPNSARKPYLELYAAAAQIGSGNADAGAASLRGLTTADTFEDVKADAYYRLAMVSLCQPQPDKAAALELLRKGMACYTDAKSLLLAATCACDMNDWHAAMKYLDMFTSDFSKADRHQRDAADQLRRRIVQESAKKAVGDGAAN